MRTATTGIALGLGLLTLAGCAAQVIAGQEDMLAAAGFHLLPADTAQGAALIAHLPPQRVVRTTNGGQLAWAFADPEICRCVYLGDERAYQHYAALRVRQRYAETQVQAAQLNSMSWGPWGPWGPFGRFGF